MNSSDFDKKVNITKHLSKLNNNHIDVERMIHKKKPRKKYPSLVFLEERKGRSGYGSLFLENSPTKLKQGSPVFRFQVGNMAFC